MHPFAPSLLLIAFLLLLVERSAAAVGYSQCMQAFFNQTRISGNDDFCDDAYDAFTDLCHHYKGWDVDDDNTGSNDDATVPGDDVPSVDIPVLRAVSLQPSKELQICCDDLSEIYKDRCDDEGNSDYSDRQLMSICIVVMLCFVARGFITHFKIKLIPEAGAVILVGMENRV